MAVAVHAWAARQLTDVKLLLAVVPVDVMAVHPAPFQGGGDLFVIADVGAHAQGRAALMFDLQMTQIELGFAARQQPHASALARESDGQAFADSPARAGDQYGDCFERVHHMSR